MEHQLLLMLVLKQLVVALATKALLVKVALLLPVVIIISIVLVAVVEAGTEAVPLLVTLTVLQVIVAITAVVRALSGQVQMPQAAIYWGRNTT